MAVRFIHVAWLTCGWGVAVVLLQCGAGAAAVVRAWFTKLRWGGGGVMR